jgi:gamma-glutamylaminecyclotransferase
MFARLDVLEDYPEFYDRQINEIILEENNEKVSCWVYMIKNFPEKLLSFPMLNEYKNSEEKPYQERSKRIANILAKNDLDYEF